MVVENPISEDFAANVSGLSRSQKREQVKQEQRELNVALAAAGKSLAGHRKNLPTMFRTKRGIGFISRTLRGLGTTIPPSYMKKKTKKKLKPKKKHGWH